MIYEWDEAKRLGNVVKHGVDFAESARFQWGEAVIEPDDRYDEPRFRALGYIGSRLHVVVYTERGDNRRIISIRKANPKEMQRYAAA